MGTHVCANIAAFLVKNQIVLKKITSKSDKISLRVGVGVKIFKGRNRCWEIDKTFRRYVIFI
jgi:hypothetical protein